MVRIPFVGSLRAGAFFGLDWVREISITHQATLTVAATYRKEQIATASIFPLRYSARNAGSSASGNGNLDVSTSLVGTISVRGFYGARPMVGVGITYTRKKWRRRGWKIYRVTESKSVNGNLGADLGAELNMGYRRSPPFAAYSGSGAKIGVCSSCHALQGSLYLKGKRLSVQAIVNGRVTIEKMLVSQLFSVRVGTLCVIRRMCEMRRQIEGVTKAIA